MKLFHIQDYFQALTNLIRKRQDRPHGVLLISSGGLGDTVLFSHVVERFISLAMPEERIVILCNRGSERMKFLFPTFIDFLSIDYQELRQNLAYRRATMGSLYKANFRLVVNTDYLRHPDMDEALARACRATETLAMKPRYLTKYSSRMKNNLNIYDRLFDSGPIKKDKICRWIDFSSWLNQNKSNIQMLRVSTDSLLPTIGKTAPLVIVHPYSAVKKKQFSPSLYEAIFKCIPDAYKIAITGTKSDREQNPEFEALINMPRVKFDASGFKELASRMQTAKLVISVDTACMHLATAVGAPTICLASAAYVGDIVPYDAVWSPSNVQFVYQTIKCEGCLGNCHLPAENGMYPCVARLPQENVLELVRKHFE